MADLELISVTKSFGDVKVIHGADLTIADGEFVVLVGPSGCGKSTLLRMIAGLEAATSGDIKIDGEIVNHVPASDRGLAMVFQSYALYPHMSVYKNMAFGLENTRMDRAEIKRRVANAGEILRLTDYMHRRPKALSGGQRQRVAIGRAIVRDPRIFLFDEPLSNLDAELRVSMRKELTALHADIGGTMIYVTHDQVEAMTLADRIVVLNDGRIEQVGTPLDLYNHPVNQFVAGFIGSPRMNLWPCRAAVAANSQIRVHVGGHDVLMSAALDTVPDNLMLGVRPENIEIVDEGDADLIATVAFSEQLGGETYFYCDIEGLPQITVHQLGQRPTTRGQTLPLRLQRDHLHLFDTSGPVLRHK